MTLFWAEGTPIAVRVDSQEQPVQFVWQGRSHGVAQVVQQWQVDVDWWAEHGRIAQNVLAVYYEIDPQMPRRDVLSVFAEIARLEGFSDEEGASHTKHAV